MTNNNRRRRDTRDTIRNEEALIGSVLLKTEILDRNLQISRDDFCDEELGKLWQLLSSMQADNEAIDSTLLMSRLREDGIEIDASRIAELYEAVPHIGHVDYYRSNVREASKLRRLAILADKIKQDVGDASINSSMIIENLQSEFESLEYDEGVDRPVSLGDALELVCDEIDDPSRRDCIVHYGIKSVDDYLGGMTAGEMHIIGARPSRGKTALGLQVALHNADQGHRVLFVALEMTPEEMAKRVACGATDIDSANLRNHELSPEEREQFISLCSKMCDSPLKFWSSNNVTVHAIRYQARSEQMQNGLDLLVIDYLGLLKASTRQSSHQPRWQTFTEISNSIKALAMELGIPILVCQQLGRDSDGRSPRLSDLRDSGSIEQDAHAVLLIDYNEKSEYEKDNIVLDLAKNRSGQTGAVKATFNKPKTQFCDGHQWQA